MVEQQDYFFSYIRDFNEYAHSDIEVISLFLNEPSPNKGSAAATEATLQKVSSTVSSLEGTSVILIFIDTDLDVQYLAISKLSSLDPTEESTEAVDETNDVNVDGVSSVKELTTLKIGHIDK